MNYGMHTLVKFTNHAKDFLNGCLYMNTLNYFWENGFQEQRDICEGVIGAIPPHEVRGLDPFFCDVNVTDMQLQAVGYSYCNVFCMSIVDYFLKSSLDGRVQIDIVYPPNMTEFGDKTVIIDDEKAFLTRINLAAKEYHYLCGRVKYHSQRLNGRPSSFKNSMTLRTSESYDFSEFVAESRRYDAFDKSEMYKLQNEWRICLCRGIKTTEPFRIEIGSIKDIAHVIDTKDFISNLPSMYENTKVMPSIESYYGNTDRHALRDMFYELGNNKAWMISTIG